MTEWPKTAPGKNWAQTSSSNLFPHQHKPPHAIKFFVLFAWYLFVALISFVILSSQSIKLHTYKLCKFHIFSFSYEPGVLFMSEQEMDWFLLSPSLCLEQTESKPSIRFITTAQHPWVLGKCPKSESLCYGIISSKSV